MFSTLRYIQDFGKMAHGEDISMDFFDIQMRYTAAAFLKQRLSPYCSNINLCDLPYYISCSISPQQLPNKPFKRSRNWKLWTEAKTYLTHLYKLEVQQYSVKKEEITRFMFQCLRRMNVNSEYAKILVEAFVDADMSKEFGKGLYRLLIYVADMLDKSCDGSAKPQVLKSNANTAWVDGMNSLGPVIGKYCMDLAINKAKSNGIGFVVVKNSNYLGKCTWFTNVAMEKGLIGLAFSNTPHVLCPTRAKSSFLGWNPVALSAPATKEKNNLYLEIESTALSSGPFLTLMCKGHEIPDNTAYNCEAKLTKDPKEALYEGSILPLGGLEETGGFKGYAWATMVEIMCGILGDSFYGRDLKRDPERGQQSVNLGHCFIAINPKFFGGDFKKNMNGLAKSMRKLEPINENIPVIFPGYEKFLKPHLAIGNNVRYRLVDLMAAYQLSCMLNIPPIKLKKIDYVF